MVVQMRKDSPVSSPSGVVSPSEMSLDNSCNSFNGNEWMTSTLDNKQFFSNVVTTNQGDTGKFGDVGGHFLLKNITMHLC